MHDDPNDNFATACVVIGIAVGAITLIGIGVLLLATVGVSGAEAAA